ncbi:hypothetical protein ANN_13123 [Periplaneta americana]|uniref:Uncharacterized protein n=1 Tax=Periplaneta americana TaxID=6978 RepID=A0ABQ8TIY7_PERAM|nr:hypothetical protein ANN_13123 [Periplaneta americana]
MAGLCEGGNEPAGSLKVIFNYQKTGLNLTHDTKMAPLMSLVKLKVPPAHIQACVQLIGALLLYELQNTLEKKEKRTWVKKLIRTRIMHGASKTLLKELAEEDPAEYRKHLRMSPVLKLLQVRIHTRKVVDSSWSRDGKVDTKVDESSTQILLDRQVTT